MTTQEVKQLLIGAGWPDNSINFSLAQAAFECGNLTFDSAVARADNNLTGIVFCNQPWQRNATQGTAKPQGEAAGHYAKFATVQDWANDFHRIVHAQFSWNKIGRPIDAVTVEDYVARLKANLYFESDEATYLNGVKHYLNLIMA